MARGYPARPCFADCAAFSKLPLQQLRALCAFALRPGGDSTLPYPSSPSSRRRAQLDTPHSAMLRKWAPSSIFCTAYVTMTCGPFKENSLGVRDLANSSLHLFYQPRIGWKCLMSERMNLLL